MNNHTYLLRKFLLNYKTSIYQISIAYFTGRFINEFYGDSVINNIHVLWNKFFACDNNPFNILTWLAIGLSIFTIIALTILNKWNKKDNDATLINAIKRDVIDQDIREFMTNHIAWGTCLTIQKATDMDKGWLVDDIIINKNILHYAIKDKTEYKRFFDEKNIEYKFFDDRTKYMLTKNPIALIDSPTLFLDLMKCKFSEVQYNKSLVENNLDKKQQFIKSMLTDLKIDFPNTLCLHLVVITNDDKVLITKRSPKLRYYPNKWSVSIEEQFDDKDTENDISKGVSNLFCRAMSEELALSTNYFNLKNSKVLSVFLESDIMNISLCGIVHLDISSIELNDMLSSKISKDNEFTEWKFLTWDELIDELNPEMEDKFEYHASSKYRILMSLIYKFGRWKITKDIRNWDR